MKCFFKITAFERNMANYIFYVFDGFSVNSKRFKEISGSFWSNLFIAVVKFSIRNVMQQCRQFDD